MIAITHNHLKLFEEFNLENTKDRLIKVALETFAQKGYDNTPVRELALKADANIAAINYHFGGKEGLYHAVLEYIADYMDSWAMPLLNEYEKFLETQDKKLDIDETLLWIHSFLNTFISTALESYESNILLHKIIAREQLRQTFEFDKIYGSATIKLAEYIIGDLLSRIANKDINSDEIIIYTQSIIGQIETFISVNGTIYTKLDVKELSKKQIEMIKSTIIKNMNTIILDFK